METPHPLPLNTYSGTLAVDLGCCPFDYPTYLVQSDSYGSPSWHSRFDNLWQTLTSPRVFSALPPYGCHRASPKAISGRTSYLRVRLEFLPYPHLIATLFNGCAFGPPLPFTATSTWTWIDHPVSGLLRLTMRPIQTWFPFGSGPLVLNLASQRNSPDRSTKSTRLYI